MDIQTALIGVATFIVSAGVLLFISMFGMKEKSYEEALAEQRQQANALLGNNARLKSKEKKLKKAKKVKDKQATVPVESETAEESEDTESPSALSSTQAQQKLHVEFKEPTVEAEPVVEAQEKPAKSKRGKKEKVRPILIHKSVESPVGVDPVDAPPANHFEQLHPKDEFELLQSHLHSKEEAAKAETKEKSKPKQNGVEEASKEKGKVRQNSLEGKEKVRVESTKDKKEKPQHQQQPENSKEKKDKLESNKEKPKVETSKEKLKEKQVTASPEVQKQKKMPKATQPAPEKEEPVVDIVTLPPATNGYVASTAKEKKKKKNELNSLQQLTGAKDGDLNLSLLLNAVRKAELSRSEVQILIDLLLNKQHEAPAVVDEWSEGKADPIQKLKKQLAEKEKALVEEQEALVGAQTKLREIRAEQAADKTQLQQRARGLEEALQAKHLELQAANSRFHTQNQKIQQMQAQLNEEAVAMRKLRDENAALQMQRQQIDIHIAQAQEAEATIQDLQARNNQLTMELRTLTEQNLSAKEHQQNLIVQLQHQVNHFKSELDEKDNFARQCEDIRRDLEHRLGLAHRLESELKVELSQLKSVCQQNAEEVRRLEHGKGQALEEVRSLQKQKDELEHALAQLKMELRDVQAEKSELQMLKANGISQENQAHKEELLNLHNELSSVKSELQFVQKKYAAELDASRNSVKQLQHELDEQKTKNNELRKKNWKVMEALKAAESKTVGAQSPKVDEMISHVRLEEQEANRKFIQRLFPDVKISDSLPHDQWVLNVESTIQKHISELEKLKTVDNHSEVAKLQAQIQHYKSIIDDTEGILKKLQNHIEQEEIHWRKELKSKESEIDALKQQHLIEMQTKLQQLESLLGREKEEKRKVIESYEALQHRSSSADAIDLQKNNSNVESNICTEQNSTSNGNVKDNAN